MGAGCRHRLRHAPTARRPTGARQAIARQQPYEVGATSGAGDETAALLACAMSSQRFWGGKQQAAMDLEVERERMEIALRGGVHLNSEHLPREGVSTPQAKVPLCVGGVSDPPKPRATR
jgi:hypothetical protein